MILFKKAVRSMLDNKKAYLACIVLIGVGIFVYVSLAISAYSLDSSKNTYYKNYNFPDIFATVGKIPYTEVDSVSKISGIEKISGTRVYDARVLLDDSDEIINLRLNSSKNMTNGINDFCLVKGNYLFEDNDIMISDDFLESHNLKIGDKIKLGIEGKEYTFNICAAVQSPEYIFAVKDEKSVLPDPAAFSFAYLKENVLGNALGTQGFYNNLYFTLESGFVFDDVKNELEDSLKKYSIISLVEREDQISHSMLKAEIDGIRSMLNVIPAVFIAMSMAILYLMLKRVIEQDRTQIGTLKAFGYSNREILFHYLFYGFVTGLLGGIVGVIVGYMMSDVFIGIFLEFFKIPTLVRMLDKKFIINGILFAVGGGILGAFMGASSVIKLHPADAMRSKAPKTIKNDFLKVFPFLKYVLTSRGNMAIRSIQRAKVRSIFIVIGIMFAFGIMAFMGSYSYMMDSILMEQFTKIQVYDVKVTLKTPINYNTALETINSLDNVIKGEALFEVPVEFKNKHLKKGAVIIGIDEYSSLYKIYDSDDKKNLPPPKEGVIISNTLAKSLNAKRGDVLYFSSPYSKDDLKVIVWDVVVQNLGSSCYMESEALANLLETKKTATSIIFNSDDIGFVRNYLLDGKNISSIENSTTTMEAYQSMLDSYEGMIWILQVMAIIVAFAIIYNTSVISLSERTREYATLRVLGLQLREVSEIMSFEYWILCLFGMIFGVPFTGLLKTWLNSVISIDLFSLPTHTPASAYLSSVFGCVLAVLISNMTASKNIKNFDMVEVLKERE